MQKGTVILLNGPSSSGKSTLARNLNQLLNEQRGEEYGIVSIDDYLQMRQGERLYEDDVYEIADQLCEDAEKVVQMGNGVIIDHVITSERIYAQFLECFKKYYLVQVHVTCPLEQLRIREKQRGDRNAGTASDSYEYLYPKEGYDIIVDTYELSSAECAMQIAEKIKLLSENERRR